MNRNEAVAAIQLRLGFYTKKETEIVTELGISQARLEKGIQLPAGKGIFKPWFLVSEMQTAVTQIGEERVPVPQAVIGQHAGFLSEVDNASLWVIDPDAEADDPLLELEKLSYDEMIQRHPGDGLPKAYDLLGVYFRVRPVPDAVYTLKVITHNADLLLSSPTGTNKWLTWAPEVLWGHTGMQIAGALHDATAHKLFSDVYLEGVMALYHATEERLHVNKRYVMGGED